MVKRRRIETLRDRIRAGGAANFYDEERYSESTISDEDRDDLLLFSDQLDLNDYSDNRHEKLLRHLVRLAEEVGGLHDALSDREAAEKLARWVQLTYDNPQTKCDYRLALRAFGKHALRRGTRGDVPESLDWLSANTPRNYKPRPDRADMLDWEDDVLRLINDGARNPRDRALFATQFEGGFRPHCELYEMQIGDVKDGDYGLSIKVDGKTGERSVTMILAVPYLNRYLGETHPRPNDDDAYLWVKADGERMSYSTFLKYFKRAAARAGVTKPVTPKNFRKSNATWLARLGKNESFIEDRQGRERGSDAISHYVAMYGDDAAAEYAVLHGQDVEVEDPENYTPVECPRCSRMTPRDRPVCMWCSQALSQQGLEDLKKSEAEVKRLALMRVREDPTFFEEARKRESVVKMLMEDDDFLDQALGLADELGVETPFGGPKAE